MNRCIIKHAHYIGPDRRQAERREACVATGGNTVQRIERRKPKERRTLCVALDLSWRAY